MKLELPGHFTRPCCRITPTFWTISPELRSTEIGLWMEQRGHKPWPEENPPRAEAELVATVEGTAKICIVQ